MTVGGSVEACCPDTDPQAAAPGAPVRLGEFGPCIGADAASVSHNLVVRANAGRTRAAPKGLRLGGQSQVGHKRSVCFSATSFVNRVSGVGCGFNQGGTFGLPAEAAQIHL